MPFFVDPDKALQLNLRTAPKPGAVIVTLAAGTKVEKVSEDANEPHWWLVDADVNGTIVRGFLNSTFLKQGAPPAPAPTMTGAISEAHLRLAGKTRAMDGGRAFPLDEHDLPKQIGKTAAEVVVIITYLNPRLTARTGGRQEYSKNNGCRDIFSVVPLDASCPRA